jgi:hypothetical protein
MYLVRTIPSIEFIRKRECADTLHFELQYLDSTTGTIDLEITT